MRENSMTYKVRVQGTLLEHDLAELRNLGCAETPYITRPDLFIFRAEVTDEQCEKLKALSYVLSVEEMPIYCV